MYRWNKNDFLAFSIICLTIFFIQIVSVSDECKKLKKENKELIKKLKQTECQ